METMESFRMAQRRLELQSKKAFTQTLLSRLLKKYNFTMLAVTPESLLAMAIDAEETAKAVGPLDNAYMYFKYQELDYLKMAEHIETLADLDKKLKELS